MVLLSDKDPENIEKLEDQIYSFGTFPVINKIEKVLLSNKKDFDTIVINFNTIIRNNIDLNLTENKIFEKILKELNELTTDLVLIFNEAKHIFKPIIVFYYYDYYKTKIPNDYKRPLTNKTELEYKLSLRFKKHLQNVQNYVHLNGVDVFNTRYLNNKYPHEFLNNTVKSLKNKHHVILFTHQPLDYHIVDTLRKTHIIKSHTGDLLNYKELGLKTFKVNIPFTKTTHVLLGDKCLIKPFLVRTKKKEFLKITEDEQWKFKTMEYVNKAVKKLYTLPYTI